VDEKTPAGDVIELSQEFGFAEFGVLMTRSGKGKSRRVRWLEEVAVAAPAKATPRFALHLCYSRYHADSWLAASLRGDWSFVENLGRTWEMFGRVQLNLRRHVHRVGRPAFVQGLRSTLGDRQAILQLDRFDHPLAQECRAGGIKVGVLFDLSGGRGKLPTALGPPVAVRLRRRPDARELGAPTAPPWNRIKQSHVGVDRCAVAVLTLA
jgi:hypothetical protein